ncbi:type VI secretion system contractile sheath small subunit [Yersinia enterocolitica]
MVSKSNSQKFIARNRAPRVQIEYDVEIYGSEKKVELPFVMGVLADLSGKPLEPLPSVADRKLLDIDIDNFDERMKAMKPRVAFAVKNTLTGEGQLMVDITFESLNDFSPDEIAKKVDSLSQLLDARTQLANLQTYMDGKAGAEELVMKLLKDKSLLATLASAPKTKQSAADAHSKID